MSCKYETYGCRYRHCMNCKYYETPKITIKEYGSMPEVLIDGKVFVDREIFREYALNLLQQELDTAMSKNEDIGLRVAMSVIRNIR